jgi:hypothetical protein
MSEIVKYLYAEYSFFIYYELFFEDSLELTANVKRVAFSCVELTPSHYKYNKTFHSAADFPMQNPKVSIEPNRL